MIHSDTAILREELPIDSLDLATVVIEPEVEMGIDPFKDGFISFRTARELAKL